MKKRPNAYVTPWDEYQPRDTLFVSEEQRSARVTYRSEDGKRFRVVIVQRTNPIGFHARLPGVGKH